MNNRLASITLAFIASLATQVMPSAPVAAMALPRSSAPGGLFALLYVPNIFGQDVDVYGAGIRSPHLLGKLTAGRSFYPTAVCIGQNGVVYAESDNGPVYEFQRGRDTPFRMLSFPNGYFSLNYISAASDGSVFLLGAKSENADRAILELSQSGKLIRTIAFPQLQNSPATFATDREGDLFVSVNEDVFVYAPGQKQPMADLKQSAYTTGLLVDRQGQLLVGQPGADRVLVESLPAGTVLRTIATVGAGDYLALDESVNYLYAVDAGGETLQWYRYGGGRPLGFFTEYGEIAVDPGTPYFR